MGGGYIGGLVLELICIECGIENETLKIENIYNPRLARHVSREPYRNQVQQSYEDFILNQKVKKNKGKSICVNSIY